MNIQDISVEDLQDKKYQEIFPDLYLLKGLIEFGLWHNHQDIFDHILKDFKYLHLIIKNPPLDKEKEIIFRNRLSQKIDNHTREELLKLMILYHDVGKRHTLISTANVTATPGHEHIAALLIKQNKKIKDNFSLSIKELNILSHLISLHDFISDIADIYEHREDDSLLDLFSKIAGGWDVELAMFILADLYGSDLIDIDNKMYQKRENTLKYFLNYFIK